MLAPTPGSDEWNSMWAEKIEELGVIADRVVDQYKQQQEAYAKCLVEATKVLDTALRLYGLGVRSADDEAIEFFESTESFAALAMGSPSEIMLRLELVLRALRLHVEPTYETDTLDAVITLVGYMGRDVVRRRRQAKRERRRP